MLVMFSSGFLLGVLLDLVRVCREIFRFRRWSEPLTDLFYWLFSALLVFQLLWWSNWGELRFYIFIAICLGFFIYLHYLSSHASKMLRWMIFLIKRIVTTILYLLDAVVWKPVKKLFRLFRAIVMGLILIPLTLVTKWFRLFFRKNREKK